MPPTTKTPEGYLHSIQTLGAVDGPGLRFVAFLQGCPLRCQYCHNPDTWPLSGGKAMDAASLVALAARYRPYFGDQGGITLSGGEPLAQLDFCHAVAREAKARGLHLCIDTSGYRFDPQVRRLYEATDLVLLDVKHSDPAAFAALTGKSMEGLRRTLAYFRQSGRPLWLRQVIVPGLTDDPAQIEALAALVQGLNIQKAELLPYHRLGEEKWKALDLPYPLGDTAPPDAQRMAALQTLLHERLHVSTDPEGEPQ